MNNRTVLIVEDDPVVAMDMSQTLTAVGMIVNRIVSNCDEALIALKSNRPDCVLLDFKLTNENSSVVASKLNEDAIPYIVVTGYFDAAFKTFDSQPSNWVRKPFARAELIDAVSETISSSF